MATYWKFNERRRRFELVEVDDRTNQVLRVLEAFIDPAADNSDLRGVPVDNLPPEVIAALTPAAQGDPQARQQVSALYGSLMQQSLDGYQQGRTFGLIDRRPRAAPGQPGAGTQTGVRLEPEDITAQVNRFNAALDVRGAVKLLDQKEHELRQKMLAEGFDPEEFFGAPGGQPAGFPQGPGAAPQATTTGAYLPAAYVNAYTAQDQAAAAAANMARAERLQEAANRFGLRAAGAKGLRDIAAIREEMEDLQGRLTATEAHLTANPANDKQLAPGPDGKWYHPQTMGMADRLRALRKEYQTAVDAMDPKAAAARRTAAGRQQNWRVLPQGVRVRQWGEKGWSDTAPEDVDPEQARTLAATYAYTDQDAYLPPYAAGGQVVPAYQYGGQNYLPPAPGTAPPTGSPYGPPPPQFPAPPSDPEQMAKAKMAQDEQYAKEAVWAERVARARAQSEQRRAQAQAAFDQEMAEVQRERAQITAMRGMAGMNGAGQPAYAGG